MFLLTMVMIDWIAVLTIKKKLKLAIIHASMMVSIIQVAPNYGTCC